ncbi:amino acid adenylation domain-containing protein [Bradyrhizobium elkanii]|uniref:amino acid adenylation domain-containing protein n=1 Tax=Bradyrhizobium elkanii TaxID=29448 RepID=UPI001BAB0138|nr:amino acid adenylation domain-containing protein [Bradyrhizobium elkanii]
MHDLTRHPTGAWRCVEDALPGDRTRQTVDLLAAFHRAPVEAIVAAGSLALLSRYGAGNQVAAPITLSAEDGAPVTRPVSLEVSPAEPFGRLLKRMEREITRTDAQSEQRNQAELLPCRIIVLRQANSHDGNARDAPRFGVEEMLVIEWRLVATGYRLNLHYREGAHPGWLVEQFGKHLGRLLEFCLATPNAPVAGSELLDPAETSSMLQHACGEARDYPLHCTLTQLFKDQVQRTPDRAALIGRSSAGSMVELNYRDLDRRVEDLARRLASLGLPAGARVGVRMERSIELVIALLAVMRAGFIYVPLDRSYPDEYVRYILSDTRAALVIVDCAQAAAGGAPESIPVMHVTAAGDRCEAELQLVEARTGDPCLVMYTSGSTGRPKGVVHCQRQIVNRLHWMWEAYPFLPTDVIAQRSPIGVMPSMWELLGGLLAGTPTALVPDSVIRVPSEFAEFLAACRVSFITLTPTVLRLLLDARDASRAWPTTLRVVIIGGEPLTEDLYRRFRSAFPAATLVNDFGATEVNTVLHVPLRPDLHRGISGHGYRPIANVTTLILDDFMRLTPFGVQGELCIAGESVALGYLNLADITAARFVQARPGGADQSLRLYRTGDMGYMSRDGAIHVTGRRDHQIKINGMRVELGEVERTLGQHPAVAECVAVARTNPNGQRRLDAFVRLRDRETQDVTRLRSYLRKQLPSFMVPQQLELVAALPRRPNGKLDRLALGSPSVSSPPMAASTADSEHPEQLAGVIRRTAALVIGANPEAIDAATEFDALGFNSVAVVDFANRLSSALDREVPVTVLFDHPTIERLTNYLRRPSSLSNENLVTRAAAQPEALHDRPRSDSDAIAIIGMSGRFPGADDIDQFWKNLCEGVESISTLAPGRWNPEAIYDPDPSREGRSYSKWGGFLSNADEFDPEFFGVTPAEAATIDPQHRLCLMESWRALEDAGYAGISLADNDVGVFVGAREPDYPVLVAGSGRAPDANTLLGSDMSLLAARISYFCDLHGPAMVVDTACSSALVAVHLACRSLRDDECTIALAGAVCLINDPDFFVATSKLNVFSPKGRCCAFDRNADGFVQGEGVGFVVLKRLNQAVADRDHIHAVILGTAVNQDGRSNGITAPNGSAQSALQTALYRRIGVAPDTIGYVEAHGTGTSLGDPIEVEALTRSFARFTSRKQYCALGSVKTNIGHLTAAAPMAGLIKTALCISRGELVPSLHFEQPNELIDLANTPFYVNTERRPWAPAPRAVRRAALNAFGIGGTNAHAVLEQAPAREEVRVTEPRPYLVPVTAPHAQSILPTARRLLQWVHEHGASHAMRDISFSLLVGRRLFGHGHILVASEVGELADLLAAICDGRSPQALHGLTITAADTSPAGDVMADDDPVVSLRLAAPRSPTELRRVLLEVARLIAGGVQADWRQLFSAESPRRIRLPACTFATRRCWIEPQSQARAERPPNESRTNGRRHENLSEMIADAIQEVLGRSVARLDQPLSAQGVDSLKAISLQHALARIAGVKLPLEVLLESSSVADIVQSLAAVASKSPGVAAGTDGREALITRFLDGDLDLDLVSDEQLDWLHKEMLARGEVSHGI